MTSSTNDRARGVAAALLLAGLAAAAPRPASAQDARWQGWIGCWEPAASRTAPALRGTARPLALCVVPAEGADVMSVDVVTIADGRVQRRDRIDASGEPWRSTVDGCAGWESAEWSADGKRVYLTADRTCQGGLKVRTTGVISMSAQRQWLDVRSASTGSAQPVLSVSRYRELEDTAGIPAEVASALRGRALFAAAARSAVAEPVGTAEIAEAARKLEPAVVEAWLAESGQRFAVDAKQLVALDRAGVPARVIDLMVALSYPRVFAVNRATREAEPVERPAAPADSGRRTVIGTLDMYGDRYSQGYQGCGYPHNCGYGYGYGIDPYRYGISPYGYGYGGYPYGYGYGPGYGWYGNQPVVIVVRPTTPGGSGGGGGRMVKGRGHTRGGSDNDGGSAGPRDGSSSGSSSSGGSARPSSGSSGGGSSSSGSSGGSSGGGSSSGSGRTAKPRSP